MEKEKKKFLEEYKKLCDKYNMRLVITPLWKSRDDGTWSMVLSTSVEKIPDDRT